MQEIFYDTATTGTGYDRYYVVHSGKRTEYEIELELKRKTEEEKFEASFQKPLWSDNGKFYFDISNRKTGKGKKVKKVWEKPRFERKCR